MSVVLRNLTGKTNRCVARIAAANEVPEAVPSLELTKELAGTQEKETPKLTIEERQELLMELLRKDGGLEQLKEWPLELALKFERMLMEHHHIFSLDKNEIGCTNSAEHIIELMDDEPFKERFRRIAPPLLEEVRENLQDMLDGGAIQPSKSPWCNAIVLVRKKDGTLRFCIDFRKLNARTKKDSYPHPRMQETMESMVGARFFSSMDLKSGFWQVRMSEKSRQYTAFTVGSLGVYEFLRMPYGLCNAPATFQRLMQNCLGELNLTYALVYQDKKFRNLRMEDWHRAQLMDLVIPHVLDWLWLPRNNRVKLKDFLWGKVSEADCRAYGLREKDFEKRDHLLFLKTTPPENVSTIPVFVVLVNRRQVAIDMCHRNAGHQGRDQTLSLLKGRFWWPGMSMALCLSLQNCGRCKQFEAKSQIPGMEPIVSTQPMELVHIDYIGMEVTVSTKEKPVVKNVLVIVDHFTRYVQAFVTKNHTAFTTA